MDGDDMMEVAVVVGLDGQPIHWHLPPGRSMAYIPDTRDLWEVLWENRENLAGVAHSHPGSGVPGPSMTDLTTFDAVERGLGKRLAWWITSSDRMIELKWQGPNPLDFVGWEVRFPDKLRSTLNWTDELRRLTYTPEGGTS